MKNLFFLFMLFLTISCSTNKNVYWCGDHPCINKKEREAYFKKTMIVEIKNLKNKNYKNNSKIEKIMQNAQSKEKKRIKNEKDLAKQAKKQEKDLAKQIKLEEKKLIKEEKDLAKQTKLEEKKRIKEKKDLAKQIKLEEKKLSRKKIVKNQKKHLRKNVELDADNVNTEIKLSKFSELAEKIRIKNAFKPYPDINDIPN